MASTSVEMVVSLTDPSVGADRVRPARVGGKSSSLAKLFATEGLGSRVPKALALTVDFFDPWVRELVGTKNFSDLSETLASSPGSNDPAGERKRATAATAICARLQEASLGLSPTADQSEALRHLEVQLGGKLAAVRSSAPEEDGSGASFAGAFETKLAVETSLAGLEKAVKECFASLWDYRVLLYKQKQQQEVHDSSGSNIGFAVTVMEMVDSVIAGVAFSANPLNSDRDEIVIDSSWGLGESVVDGSVTADRYIVDKLQSKTIAESIGKKGNEKRIGPGGVVNKPIEEKDSRYSKSSLDGKKIKALAELVCLIEKTYGMPMDIEWAFVVDNDNGGGNSYDDLVPKLLQARPITTLFSLDPEFMTKPGEKRSLYFDSNIMSEATTTNPFTAMDIEYFSGIFDGLVFENSFGKDEGLGLMDETEPDAFIFWGRTRQYANLGWFFKFISKKKLAGMAETVDPYLASIIRSKDCDEKKYRADFWVPKGFSFSKIWELLKHTRSSEAVAKQYRKDTKSAMQKYRTLIQTEREQLHKMIEQGFDFDGNIGVAEITRKLMHLMYATYRHDLAIVTILLPLFQELDDQRQNGKTKEIQVEYEALVGGFEGDPLMEINIAIYQLAQSLPKSMHEEKDLVGLVERIREERDLPEEFLRRWNAFMKEYGFDGQDQLFISCPRYRDTPVRLLRKLQINAREDIKDPSVVLKEKVEKRRAVMAKHEEEAKEELAQACFWNTYGKKKKLAAVQKRNVFLEEMVWVRNAPKIHMTEVLGAFRIFVLKAEEKLIAEGRLDEKGDIFHLKTEEVDRALLSSGGEIDLKELVRQRKAVYERAVASNMCPIVVDSRCRILKPDPPKASDDPNTLVGAAISPGVATGIVRIITDLAPENTEGFGIGADGQKEDHVLCAVVTGPAWTPLFASASAVVLQIGGVLQHGALCAREYGKPAVSSIDIHSQLKDGMKISVDGNTGIVKILEGDTEEC